MSEISSVIMTIKCMDRCVCTNHENRIIICNFTNDLALTNFHHIFFQELELYKASLLDKPHILLINKMDTDEADEKFDKTVDMVKNMAGMW